MSYKNFNSILYKYYLLFIILSLIYLFFINYFILKFYLFNTYRLTTDFNSTILEYLNSIGTNKIIFFLKKKKLL